MGQLCFDYPNIENVKANEDFTLLAYFADKTVKKFDMAPLIQSERAFMPLRDKTLFVKARTLGRKGVSWNEEVDIAAEYIYDNGKAV